MRPHTNLRLPLLALGLATSLAVIAPAQQNPRPGAPQTTPPIQNQTQQQPKTGEVETPQTGAQKTNRDRSSADQTSATSRSRTDDTSEALVGPQDRMFLEQAAAGNVMEVQLARLAQTKASSNDVKQFASKLEKDHSAANEKLTKIAQQKGVTLPSSVPPKQQTEIDKLEKMSGDQFDRAYAKMMASHHKKDVSAYQKQSARSMDTHVKAYVDETLPTLQSHLGEAQQLASNVGRGTGRESGSAARSQSENTPSEKK